MSQKERETGRLVSIIQAIQLGRKSGLLTARRGEGATFESLALAEILRAQREERVPMLDNADLGGTDLRKSDLSGGNIRESVRGHGALLNNANLIGATLNLANLSGANLSSVYACGATLRGANLVGTNLSLSNFSGANLSRAYLFRAYLSKANLSKADLSKANLMLERNRQSYVHTSAGDLGVYFVVGRPAGLANPSR